MKNLIGKNVLITTQDWFVAPNGSEYKACYGELKGVHEAGKTLGFIPNRSHANWYIEIGNMIIMGCQVMYVIEAPERPNFSIAKAWSSIPEGGIKEYERPCLIYDASLELKKNN